MLVQDIMDRVRVAASDVAQVQFSDNTLIAWINDAMTEAATTNNLLQKDATSNTVVGTADYSLPTDILKLHSVKYNNNKVRLVTMEEFDEQFSTDGTDRGEPVVGRIWAGKLTLFPAPDAVRSLTISYIRTPTAIDPAGAINVEPDLPVGYHKRIIDYCLAQVAALDDDMNRYQMKMNEFQTGVQQLKDEPEWSNDTYPHMSVDSRDMGDWIGDYYYG